VYAVGVDMSQRGRNATLAEKMHQSMYPFLIVDMEVPKHIWIGNVCLWMAFVAPIHTGKLDRVANKEDWQIVEDKILVAILCKDLGNGGVSNYLVKIVSGDLGHYLGSLSREKIIRLLEIGKGFLPQHLHFMAHPRTSRTVSLAPFSPATVEIRMSTLVFFPGPFKNLASVRSLASCVTSNSPQAPAALAWTLL
jgi:hypothetical protein